MLGTRAAITNRWRLSAYRCTRNLVKRNVVSSLGLPVRAYPSYRIYNETCQLTLKPISPTFKANNDGSLTVVNSGRILFEFIPRKNDGTNRFDYNSSESMALSSEEIGIILQSLSKRVKTRENVQIRRYNNWEWKKQPPIVRVAVKYEDESSNLFQQNKEDSMYEDVDADSEESQGHVKDENDNDIKSELTLVTSTLSNEGSVSIELAHYVHNIKEDSNAMRVEVQIGEIEVLKAILTTSCSSFSNVSYTENLKSSSPHTTSREVSDYEDIPF